MRWSLPGELYGRIFNSDGFGTIDTASGAQTLVSTSAHPVFAGLAPYPLATPASPVISGVVNGASFQAGGVTNSWVSIAGTNLSPGTDDWSHSVVNGMLPISIDGVSVSMGGKPAYIYYISPGQINVLTPDISPGPVSVTVTTAKVTSAAFTATVSQYGTAFFLWPASQVVATHLDYSYAVQAGTFSGLTTLPAKPGEAIVLWATGFGPTSPATPAGVVVPGTPTYRQRSGSRIPRGYSADSASIGGISAHKDSFAVAGAARDPLRAFCKLPE